MPNAVLRVLLAGAALLAALLMSGIGMGVAAADPEDPANPTDPGTGGGDPPTSSEPEPTTGLPPTVPQPSIFDIPQTIATQLRDMFGKPLSIFGNGRVPGTLTTPDVPTEGASTGRKRDRPITGKIEPKPDLTPPTGVAPTRRGISTVEVTLPFTPKITVPVPSVPVPGYENVRWSLNLTDPYAAYTSVGETLSTVNSLLMDAYAPYDPFRPPAPKPQPTFRTMQEEPSVVEVEGTGGIVPMSNGSSGLPVLQAPVVVPPIRVAPPPRPITGSAPAGVKVLAAGSAGVRAPELKGSVAQTGSIPTEQLPPAGSASASASGMGAPAPRQGYPRYLRTARTNELAMVAVPGLAALIAVTLGGGVIGYRQANSGRYLRTDAARFLQ
ncbi:hypothetical protein D8S82_21835 [Mycobacterium hodleri]|uniref:Uncharacterized protein n=1 Tax=Mycolicibacterium hodleri TaxID=49897 RepID=A0A544VX10_9MYCO|nr:hypothetical protein [Mycolicibacterium hodleri]TQR84526.1 hypothetical protein D8S82_21835 [Mycolicibacterium hodleri]